MTSSNRFAAVAARTDADVPAMRRKPQRITITISWGLYQRLLGRSDIEGRSLSNLAAHLLELGVS